MMKIKNMSQDRPHDPQYERVRSEVLNRDKNICRYPRCKRKKKLQVHHIYTYSSAPSLRNTKGNLITLCKKHHSMVWGKEEYYAEFFYEIVHGNN